MSTKRDARKVLLYYERRWLIEEFHKSRKSGCRIDKRAVQAEENLERLAIITAQVAIRLLQLRSAADLNPEASCEGILTRDEAQCLWATTERGSWSQCKTQSVRWALTAIARLGGWRDTKRTGRIGWDTLWKGWSIFEERVAGWKLAREINT